MIRIYFLQRTLFLSILLNGTPQSSTFRDHLSLADHLYSSSKIQYGSALPIIIKWCLEQDFPCFLVIWAGAAANSGPRWLEN